MAAPCLLFFFLLQTAVFATASAQEVDPRLYAVNGRVTASCAHGTTLYIAGDFDHVGQVTGGGLLFDLATGRRLPFPEVAGAVSAAVPDGNGGWFIGGDFAWVGGVPRRGLAHVTADNAVAAWDPAVKGRVSNMAKLEGTLFVGGDFDTVGVEPRSGLAAFDVATGGLTAWNPEVEGSTLGIHAEDGRVFISADWMKAAGKPRLSGIVAVDPVVGKLLRWDPPLNGPARCLTTSRGTVYVVGAFDRVGATRRDGVAALDAKTGLVKPWNPKIQRFGYDENRGEWRLGPGVVTEIAVAESTIYLSGAFGVHDGERAWGFGVVDAVSGKAISESGAISGTRRWSLLTERWVTPLGAPDALVVCESTLVVTERRESWKACHTVAFNRRTREGRELARPDGDVSVLAWDGNRLFVGGDFTSSDGKRRKGLAAIDLATGSVTPWDPDPDGLINAIAATDSAIYVGGSFTWIGEQRRHNLAALDPVHGGATGWDPAPEGPNNLDDGRINALTTAGGQIIAAGYFHRIGGQERKGLAALSPQSAEATAWNPAPNHYVSAIADAGASIFICGAFDSVGGAKRNGIAELDLAQGSAKSWTPPDVRFLGHVVETVEAIAVSGFGIFLGGLFESVGDHPRRNLALLDRATGALMPWDPTVGVEENRRGFEDIATLAVGGSTVYVGEGSKLGSPSSGSRLWAVDMSSGKGWSLPEGSIEAWGNSRNIFTVSVTDSLVIVGGAFKSVGPHAASGIVGIRRKAHAPSPGGRH